jgi:uncharacterized MnhB-related membrane protein
VTALQIVVLLLVAAAGTAVALTRDPKAQAFVLSLNGLILGVYFMVMQAPDVALSEIAIGAVALPVMLLVAVSATEVRRS